MLQLSEKKMKVFSSFAVLLEGAWFLEIANLSTSLCLSPLPSPILAFILLSSSSLFIFDITISLLLCLFDFLCRIELRVKV